MPNLHKTKAPYTTNVYHRSWWAKDTSGLLHVIMSNSEFGCFKA